MGWGAKDGRKGEACERVKGDFLISLHTGVLIVRELRGGDGSECG